jgi:hypothetical protein
MKEVVQMVKVGEKLLIAVKVVSVIETEGGIYYKVAPLDKDRYYSTLEIVDKDIQSCLGQEVKGGK